MSKSFASLKSEPTKMAAKIMTIFALLSLLSLGLCNDLRAGYLSPNSRQRIIFEQKFDYAPNIYTRSELVKVNTNGDELISLIEVYDLRELKDGNATIVAGGVGQRFVDIQLAGPSVFRGMTFLVKVYSTERNGLYSRESQVGEYTLPYSRGGYDNYDQQARVYENQFGVKG